MNIVNSACLIEPRTFMQHSFWISFLLLYSLLILVKFWKKTDFYSILQDNRSENNSMIEFSVLKLMDFDWSEVSNTCGNDRTDHYLWVESVIVLQHESTYYQVNTNSNYELFARLCFVIVILMCKMRVFVRYCLIYLVQQIRIQQLINCNCICEIISFIISNCNWYYDWYKLGLNPTVSFGNSADNGNNNENQTKQPR